MSKLIKIKKGLNIPLAGDAEKILQAAPRANTYAVCPPDFHGLTPKMLVREGDTVKAGAPLFFDKYNEEIVFVSPVSGVFSELIRGEKRRIMEVRIVPDEQNAYVQHDIGDVSQMDRASVISLLLKSGVWPVLRQRPYAVIPNPEVVPRDIFISCFSTNPVGPDLDFVVNGQEDIFQSGLDVLARLTDGAIHLGVDARNTTSRAFLDARGVQINHFSGPHPAGNVGIQIHHVKPLNKGEVVWHLDVQDVIIVGRLFKSGRYDASKIIALTGPEVLNPRYYRMISGGQISGVLQNNLHREKDISPRFISGDVLTGRRIDENGFLGFYDNQITVVPEGNKRELLGWLIPNLNKFSVSRTFFSFLMPGKKFRLDTNIRSGERPFVVTGLYEKVLPMDIIPMALFKAIMINDIDQMEQLGIYELAPEDVALCEFVCPSKIEIQTIVREGLDAIRREFI
jgi:Na+-transporting NADH:ubiquinone oxidoreductase subunit A